MTRVQYTVSGKNNCADQNVVISNIQMQMICDIPVFFGQLNFNGNFNDRSHITN